MYTLYCIYTILFYLYIFNAAEFGDKYYLKIPVLIVYCLTRNNKILVVLVQKKRF